VLSQRFKVPEFNKHYEGEYSDRMVIWRRIAARDKASNLQTLLRNRQITNVLEVGCGTGAVLAAVRDAGIGSSHIGVDIADPSLHRDERANNLDLKQYDGETLPYPDQSFELVFASHVVEHVPHPRRFLEELARVSRRFVYVEVPCELHARTSFGALQTSLDIGHINHFSPEAFLLLLQTSGLNVEAMEIFDHSFGVHSFQKGKVKGTVAMALRRSLRELNRTIASRVFTYHCGALATV
jgi:SAM-dependent methyltransferase